MRVRRLLLVVMCALLAACTAPPPAAVVSLGATLDLPVSAIPGGGGVTLRPVDGGTDYYARFQPGLPTDPSFFPIATWFASVHSDSDTAFDQLTGLNTYLALTADSDLALVRSAGMYAIHGNLPGSGTESVGWVLTDEVDMWAGPGNGPWSGLYPAAHYPSDGSICTAIEQPCGFTVQRTVRASLPADGRLTYANYAKGVSFWNTDAAAAAFLNDFQDLVTIGVYWFTDNNVCDAGEGGRLLSTVSGSDGGRLADDACHRAANYGATIQRARDLLARSKPVWTMVEVGHPFVQPEWPTIRPDQISAAVWSSLIHGARGVVYFNHSFSGPCPTTLALRESCYAAQRRAVSQLNARITRLAPVLNAPYADNLVGTGTGVDVAAKWYRGNFYLLAGSTRTGEHRASFAVPCVGDATVTVLDEHRTIPLRDGRFTDTFANANAVHLYRIDGGSSCGAPIT